MDLRIPARYPARLAECDFHPLAYYYMFQTRVMEQAILDLFKRGVVKGTAALSIGNEATAAGMALPLRPGKDVVSLLHRDFASHLILGVTPYQMLCQFMANAESITHGREGNVHHGNCAQRRFPMVSHLGNMLGTVAGGVYAARMNGENVFGLAILGDGGSSTGDVHEALNFTSVRKIPVLFLIENNHYAYSTPTSLQFNCARLSDRAKGYGITGRTIDGTDAWGVYTAVCDALDEMDRTGLPVLLESMTLRLEGHAPYDKAEYIAPEQKRLWYAQDPLPKGRAALAQRGGFDESRIVALEKEITDEVNEQIDRALRVGRPSPVSPAWDVYAPATVATVEAFVQPEPRTTNMQAVTLALDYILAHNPEAFIMGQDVGVYGSAFKTCKGLFEKYGTNRVMDTPLCESATTGIALGASQVGGKPIVEYQFADFSTEAVTILGINTATWYFRSGSPAQVLYRLPCGGGVGLGPFHSGEFEGLWSRFPGLKILYPVTPQETFEALVAGFHDPNPVLIMEHKFLYIKAKGPIDFNGDLKSVWRARQYSTGNDVTIVATGAMVGLALEAATEGGFSADIVNPFVLYPLDAGAIVESVRKTGRLLVVQESGETAGLGHTIISQVCAAAFTALKCAPVLVAGPDTPVPFAAELEQQYRPDKNKVTQAIARIIGETR